MKTDTIKSITNCPTCGSEVNVNAEGETHFYVPLVPPTKLQHLNATDEFKNNPKSMALLNEMISKAGSEKPFYESTIRNLQKKVSLGEISFGKMVELMNEIAAKFYENDAVKFLKWKEDNFISRYSLHDGYKWEGKKVYGKYHTVAGEPLKQVYVTEQELYEIYKNKEV